MNIPDEILERATRRIDVSVGGQGFAHIHTDPQVIAEWARKEALLEAADLVDELFGPMGGPDWADDMTTAEAIRALAEGFLMDSSNAEKAISLEELRMSPAERIMFTAGRASRDAEVAELTRLLAESRARFGDSETRRAELEAVRDRVLKMAAEDDAGAWDAHQELIRQVLAASPSVVLEDRDREIAARAVEAAADDYYVDAYTPDRWTATWLRERAAAIRKGDNA